MRGATAQRSQRLVGLPTALGRGVIAVLAAALMALAGLVLDRLDLQLVNTFDRHIGDWRIAYGSPPSPGQRPDISVFLIDETTLLDYESRSPIDRRLLAELIRAIDAAGPKAIGIDMIFDRRTARDADLIDVIRNAKSPIVLGSIDQRVAGIPEDSLAIQAELLAAFARPVGHLMIGRKMRRLATPDSVARYVAPSFERRALAVTGTSTAGTRGAGALNGAKPPDAFVDVLAEASGVKHRPLTQQISWLRPPVSGAQLFPTLMVPRHAPTDVKPALDGLFRPGWRDFVAGRTVLIGATMLDRDQHITPLSVMDGAPMAGVLIHAQALAQRIDGDRDVRPVEATPTLLGAFLVALGCFVLARATGFNPQGVMYGVVGGILLAVASFVAYRWLRIDIPTIALATAWAGGGFAGFMGESIESWLRERRDRPG